MNKLLIKISRLTLLSLIIPSSVLLSKAIRHYKGSDDKYSVENTLALNNNKLFNKKIIFLGSSVTYGAASKGESFVDYLQKIDGIIPIKEALSGTTLVDEYVKGNPSYIERLKKLDKNMKIDGFVCQLSTNDATMNKPLGQISTSYELNDFDTKTIIGAIEYIIAYARNTWNCPIIFYTGTKYKSDKYKEMVDALYDISKKWDIKIIDLYNDEKMNQISKERYLLYMVDKIHPSRAGYRNWWTPKFEEELLKYID